MIVQHNGIQLSSLPTTNHRLLMHVRINTLLKQKIEECQKIDTNPKHQFQLSSGKRHIKAYVDPSELSYNSYENILNLDEFYFGPKLDSKTLNLTIDSFQKINNYYKFEINDHENLLMELHKMNLYTLPFNNLSRGGKRMIFSSLILANLLQQELKQAINDDDISTDLNSINHVFRLNCFSPQSGNFKTHYDTPFSDNQRKLYSKYTLLIYLTGGSNPQNSCLTIADQKINQIPAYTGIIFDQRYEHEGWPYIQGDKIFLRTELIYHIKDIDEDGRVAQIFNKSCYFHKESLCVQEEDFAQQLQKYSNQLFNHTAKLRYILEKQKQSIIDSKYLLKKNLDIFYVTDGNSFWFRDNIPLNFIAKLILVDYFNGRMDRLSQKIVKYSQKMRIKSKPFKINVNNLSIKSNLNKNNNAMEEQKSMQYKSTHHGLEQKSIDQQIFYQLNKFSFEQDQEQLQPYPYSFSAIVDTGIKDYDIQQDHCSLCQPRNYSTSEYQEKQAIQTSQKRLYNKLENISVVLFNGKLYIDQDKVEVDSLNGQISFNKAFLNKTINFASCQCSSYSRRKYIGKQTVQVQGFLLPKIKYHRIESCKGYKLSIDMFKNGFIHRVKTEISRPYAVDPNHETVDEPFYDSNDDYVNSDSDYDEHSRKKKPDIQIQSEFKSVFRKRRNLNFQQDQE